MSQKVLLATSKGSDRQLAQHAFEAYDVRLIDTTNGIQALDMFIEHGNDAVFSILGAGLPVRNGLDLVRILKKSSRFSHIPILLVVDSKKSEAYEKASKSWSEEVAGRPLDQDDLKRAFESLRLEQPLSAIQNSS